MDFTEKAQNEYKAIAEQKLAEYLVNSESEEAKQELVKAFRDLYNCTATKVMLEEVRDYDTEYSNRWADGIDMMEYVDEQDIDSIIETVIDCAENDAWREIYERTCEPYEEEEWTEDDYISSAEEQEEALNWR